jgi:DNA-binding transcriptional LysR family regulator
MSHPGLTDLNNVRFFLEVVRSGSFSAAARSFALPPSSVSRRMTRLEDDLGARLLQRTTRSLQLTDAGRAYLAHAQRALEALEAGHRALGELQQSVRGRVRLTAPTGFGETLWPILSTFLCTYGDVRLELDLTDRFVDLVGERFDLGLRSTHETSSTLVGRRFSSSPRQLFASPSYVEARAVPRTVKDLERHDCIILGSHAHRAMWSLITGKTRRKVAVRGRIAVNEPRLAARSAAAGLGIALLPRSLCRPFLETGDLRQVLPRVSGGASSLWLVYPDRRLSAAARALADFIVSELPGVMSNKYE